VFGRPAKLASHIDAEVGARGCPFQSGPGFGDDAPLVVDDVDPV